MFERVAKGKSGAQGLAADEPAVGAQRLADRFELRNVGVWGVRSSVVGRRRAGVAEELDNNGLAECGEGLEVQEPVGAAGEKAVDKKQVGAALPVGLVVEERILARQEGWRSTSPLKRALRFSRNAAMPSRASG